MFWEHPTDQKGHVSKIDNKLIQKVAKQNAVKLGVTSSERMEKNWDICDKGFCWKF
jgi:hypothetical protein